MIPKDKIQGLRFGQLIHAAITNHLAHYHAKIEGNGDAEIADKLFYIENRALQEAIKRVLNEKHDLNS